MALHFVQVEEISEHLRQVPRLVDQLAGRHGDFSDSVLKWLKRAEQILEEVRNPAVSHIANARASLLQAARGVKAPDLVLSGRPSRRKIQEATASSALNRCSTILNELIAERLAVFAEAERVSRQLMVVAEAKGMIDKCRSSPTHRGFLDCLRNEMANDQELAGAALQLESVVGKHDLLVFLDRAMPTSAS